MQGQRTEESNQDTQTSRFPQEPPVLLPLKNLISVSSQQNVAKLSKLHSTTPFSTKQKLV